MPAFLALGVITAALVVGADARLKGGRSGPGLLANASGQAASQPIDGELGALYDRLRALTGRSPRLCGDFIRRSGDQQPATLTDLGKALDYGRGAAAAGESFWLAHGGFAVEGCQIEGLLAGPAGVIQHFSYDSYASRFVLAECHVPRLELLAVGLGPHVVCAHKP